MTGHFLQRPIWQGSPHSCFPQLSIRVQLRSQGWSAGTGELRWGQQGSLHRWFPHCRFFLHICSHLKGLCSVWQHSIFLDWDPHWQSWSVTFLQGGQRPSWQLLGHKWPQSNFRPQGIPQMGMGSAHDCLKSGSPVSISIVYLPHGQVVCSSGVWGHGLHFPTWHFSSHLWYPQSRFFAQTYPQE